MEPAQGATDAPAPAQDDGQEDEWAADAAPAPEAAAEVAPGPVLVGVTQVPQPAVCMMRFGVVVSWQRQQLSASGRV